MKYGYFDSENREYVIERADTPSPWANYLGSPQFGSLISNNAGGYAFKKSGASGRILRYVFNNEDRPGRYVYLRDDDSHDYWSNSWQPVGKDFSVYKNECRHGLGYTRISADYSNISSSVLYYVPHHQEYEIWQVKVKNNDNHERHLTVSGYCEFTNHNHYEQDQVNLQYSLFITRTHFEDDCIHQVIQENMRKENGYQPEDVDDRYFLLLGEKVDSYCGDKEAFLGRYHSYGNPVGIENGNLGNALNYCLNSCGALSTKLTLQPGEEKVFCFALGMMDEADVNRIRQRYTNCKSQVGLDLHTLKDYWRQHLEPLQVHTPSESFNEMMNTWNAYNCYMTFIWSRAASFYYCGLRNGYGYRDTVQDIQGIIHLDPVMAKEKIDFMLSAQVHHGAGLPLVKFTHHPGHEDTPEDASYVKETGHPAYRADDALWLFPTVYKYICETGNTAYLNQVIPFADRDEGTVFEHLRRALHFSKTHLGKHGMPAGLYADWNDCLRLGKDGESTFVAFQYVYALDIMKQFAGLLGEGAYAAQLDKDQKEMTALLQNLCFDNDRFIRGFREDGKVIGQRTDKEASMWLNPQSWAVISKVATGLQADHILNTVNEKLNTKYGALLMTPPYHEEAFDGSLMACYNAGEKENAGIFQQSQGWLILAEALNGNGNRAFQYYEENCPAKMNEEADIRKMEPYCYGQFTEGKDSPYFGRSHVHWLTGTASTIMVGSVEGILGLRPDLYGLRLAPTIPSNWKEFEMNKVFRGKRIHIVVKNPHYSQNDWTSITLNGENLKDNYLPIELLKEENEVVLTM